RQAPGDGEHLLSQATGHGRGARHHVADHVAAGAERRDERVVHGAYCRLEIALQDAVELVALTRRHAQWAVAVGVSQLVDHAILSGAQHAAATPATPR